MKRFQIYLNKELYKASSIIASLQHKTASCYIREALKEKLDREDPEMINQVKKLFNESLK